MKEQLIEGSRQHAEYEKKINKVGKKIWVNGKMFYEETPSDVSSHQQTNKSNQGNVEFF